jgi:hypothetical protein
MRDVTREYDGYNERRAYQIIDNNKTPGINQRVSLLRVISTSARSDGCFDEAAEPPPSSSSVKHKYANHRARDTCDDNKTRLRKSIDISRTEQAAAQRAVLRAGIAVRL